MESYTYCTREVHACTAYDSCTPSGARISFHDVCMTRGEDQTPDIHSTMSHKALMLVVHPLALKDGVLARLNNDTAPWGAITDTACLALARWVGLIALDADGEAEPFEYVKLEALCLGQPDAICKQMAFSTIPRLAKCFQSNGVAATTPEFDNILAHIYQFYTDTPEGIGSSALDEWFVPKMGDK